MLAGMSNCSWRGAASQQARLALPILCAGAWSGSPLYLVTAAGIGERGAASPRGTLTLSAAMALRSIRLRSHPPQELIAVKLTLAWPEFHIASFRRGDALLLMVLGSQARFTTDAVHLTNGHGTQIILRSIKAFTTSE
jgi:hypothetical protein